MDLFSFLDETPAEDTFEDGSDAPMDTDVPSSRKRRADSPSASPPERLQSAVTNGEAGPSSKKPRTASPKPVVVDEFETEAKREVAASAGLTGTGVDAGSRLELRHQVCTTFIEAVISSLMPILGPTPSRRPAWLPIHSHIATCPTNKAIKRVQIYARPIPAGFYSCNTAQRERSCVGSHQCRQDSCRRVRDCAMLGEETAGHLHKSYQGEHHHKLIHSEASD
jgi:hypothetical protein